MISHWLGRGAVLRQYASHQRLDTRHLDSAIDVGPFEGQFEFEKRALGIDDVGKSRLSCTEGGLRGPQRLARLGNQRVTEQVDFAFGVTVVVQRPLQVGGQNVAQLGSRMQRGVIPGAGLASLKSL